MAKGVIYKYTFPDGRVYIGQTRRPIEIRQREHIDPKIGPLNTGFWEAYEKHHTYEFEILEAIEHPDVDVLVRALNQMETAYIHGYNATDPRYGCNKMAHGMEKTDTHQILHQAFHNKMDEVAKSSRCLWKSIQTKLFDTHVAFTQEEKELLHVLKYEDIFRRASNIFETIDDEHPEIKLPEASDPDFAEFMMEEQMEALEYAIECDCETIAEEFIQQHASEIIDEYREKYAILQLDAEGNIVRKFYSLQEIADAFGVKRPENVRNVLWGKQKTAYGYSWKYKHPEFFEK